MYKSLRFVAAVLGFVVWGGLPSNGPIQSAAFTSGTAVSIVPMNTYVSPAETCTIQVYADESIDSLGCVEVWLEYDTSLVELVVGKMGALFDGQSVLSFPQAITEDTYSVEGCLLGYRTYTLPPGEMARYVFVAKKAGVCPLRITRLKLWDIDRNVYEPTHDPNAWIIIGNPSGVKPPPPRQGSLVAYPNPFNPATTLVLDLSSRPEGQMAEDVSLAIYDATGRLVRRVFDGILGPGQWPFAWDGRNDAGNGVTSGVYFAVAEARGQLFRTKLVLVR